MNKVLCTLQRVVNIKNSIGLWMFTSVAGTGYGFYYGCRNRVTCSKSDCPLGGRYYGNEDTCGCFANQSLDHGNPISGFFYATVGACIGVSSPLWISIYLSYKAIQVVCGDK
jgi:hypothetical protein